MPGPVLGAVKTEGSKQEALGYKEEEVPLKLQHLPWHLKGCCWPSSALRLAGRQAAGRAGVPDKEGPSYLLLMRYSTGNCFSPDATTDLCS